ncbi:MAG: lysophospholipid acyltransferase family protein [Planctomycetes bacterium]|nr:lysophospholipid acyltransferase family protein [Planctomycetota bacterium]MCC7172611.1 lysophospholipid acyltransferase family protein [Planctomycetota bacterium]
MNPPRKRLRDRILPTLVSWLGPAILKLLAATWRVERHGLDGHVERKHGRSTRNFVVAFWHATLLPLTWRHRGEGANVLVSQHGDGELIVRVLLRLGYRVERGSTTRGGAKALRGLVQFARSRAGDFGITPDGPKGPPRVAQQGLAFLASVSGFPILPLGLACSNAWRLRSWDRFVIPKPGARVVIVAGRTIEVPRDALDQDLAPYLRDFEDSIAEAEREAQRRLETPL